MREMQVPVIIYHEGVQEYLKVCINHTKKYNERVILLGDESNKELCNEWYNAIDYVDDSRWNEFLKYFENYSFYDDVFVKQIFKRLFVIENFIEKNKIERFALLDSDILIYINFSKTPYVFEYDAGCLTVEQQYEDYRWLTNIGISFFSKEALADFVSFCIDEYKNHKDELLLKWHWQQETKTPGGIGEMPLAYLWQLKTHLKVLNLAKPYENYGIYENAANSSGNYVGKEYKFNKFLRIKKVKFIDSHPYFINANTGKPQKVDGMHFSTVTKKFMETYSRYEKITLYMYWKIFLEKVQRKFGIKRV